MGWRKITKGGFDRRGIKRFKDAQRTMHDARITSALGLQLRPSNYHRLDVALPHAKAQRLRDPRRQGAADERRDTKV